ncbi:hypothetical protein [Acinetobacter pittii]|uniref:hypothetical protein n=1 Tax=Acinetobacter pittii TaxID=48296 RepID=UPI000837F705|nr:hypothetical protein [Acinetobacter pittii]OCY90884.1 hypothetical protein BFR67_08445 [Acinetobacter pittii]
MIEVDKCREEFESLPLVSDWIDEVFFEQRHDEYQGGEDFGRGWVNGAWEMFQHQQAKVDGLQKQVNYWNKAYENLKLQFLNKEIDADIDSKKIIDLQKRVDAAMQVFEKGRNGCFDIYDLFGEVEQALKAPQSITFKAGDKVVFDNTKQYCALLPNHMMEYVDIHPEWPQDILVLIDGVLSEVSYKTIRHATSEEIVAGQRIDGVEQ